MQNVSHYGLLNFSGIEFQEVKVQCYGRKLSGEIEIQIAVLTCSRSIHLLILLHLVWCSLSSSLFLELLGNGVFKNLPF